MSIDAIKKISITNQVFDQIKNNIISGEWSPGNRIPSETELSKSFGVSRVSIRTAVQKLNVLGLLVTKQGDGTFVSELSPGMYMNSLMPMLILNDHQLLEILEFRRIIEIESAKLAAQSADPEDIATLEMIMRKMEKASDDRKVFAMEDSNFHTALAKAGKNSIIYKVNIIIKDLLLSHQIKIQELLGPSGALKYHPQIIDAIKKGDADLAERIMEEHIAVTIDQVQNEKAVADLFNKKGKDD
jgi:GntR family transcriptional repressor for pyruvate dehydrogenase complex